MKGISLHKNLMLVFLLLFSSSINAGDDKPQYNISEIPLNLLIDADAVIRNNSTVFRVESEKKAVVSRTYTVTVLNKQGQHFGKLYLSYDKSIEIDDLEARLYDATGKEIRELDDDEIRDNASISWAKLYSDWRYKAAELYHNQFPYTVEFTFKQEFDGYINWPSWTPEKENASVQYSSYEVILPKEFELRYRSYNWDKEPVISPRSNDNVSYFWDVVNLPPFKSESIGPPVADQYKSVITAPVRFKMDDYEGDLTTWQNFGLWSKELWEGRQQLPPGAAEELNALLTPEMGINEKICVLYNYLQSKTRYVDLNAGIGGWQPVEAEKVHECGYGDCKALSNYMVALLDIAGIRSYPVLIELNGKPEKLEKSFSYNQFNHVIVCVPEETDTVWLECTSKSAPCGFLGPSTENRYGLLISANGGTLVRTPSSNSLMNKKITKAFVDLENRNADISIEYSGSKAIEANNVYKNPSTDGYDEWVESELDIPSVKVVDKSIRQIDEDTLSTVLNAKVSIPNFASSMGSRIFFTPCLIAKGIGVPGEIEDRKYPVVFSSPFREIDSITYKMPPGTVIEAQPEDISMETEYYKFSSEIKVTDSSAISYVRFLEVKNTMMPAEVYNSLREFMKSILQADSRKVVLKKD